jgi:hypothetical protein
LWFLETRRFRGETCAHPLCRDVEAAAVVSAESALLDAAARGDEERFAKQPEA